VTCVVVLKWQPMKLKVWNRLLILFEKINFPDKIGTFPDASPFSVS